MGLEDGLRSDWGFCLRDTLLLSWSWVYKTAFIWLLGDICILMATRRHWLYNMRDHINSRIIVMQRSTKDSS